MDQFKSEDGLLPCFLDFEASSLGIRSYPIQVAWSLPDGSVYDRYIRPEPGWVDWSADSEEIHGISRRFLADVGRPAREVAEELNEALDPHNVAYCDGGRFDEMWLETLFSAAASRPLFCLGDADGLIADLVPDLLNDMARVYGEDSEWQQLKRHARSRVPGPQHRAQNDVKYLIEWYRLAEQDAQAKQVNSGNPTPHP